MFYFFSNVDNIILGKFNGVQYQAHAFASNVVGNTRRVEYLGYVLMIWNCYHYITFVFHFCSVSTLYYFCQKRKRIVLLLILTSKTIFVLLIFTFDCKFCHCLGLQKRVIEMVVLEYLKIQLHLSLTSQVSIVCLFSKDEDKETNMRSILRNKCSRDGAIVYEKDREIHLHQQGCLILMDWTHSFLSCL
jgi:hypothetical protein